MLSLLLGLVVVVQAVPLPESLPSDIALTQVLGMTICLYLVSLACVLLSKSEARQYKFQRFKEHLPSLKNSKKEEGDELKPLLDEMAGVPTDDDESSGRPQPQMNGKLIHVFGQMESLDELKDREIGFTVKNVLRMHRTVEIFQWKEQVVDKESGYALSE